MSKSIHILLDSDMICLSVNYGKYNSLAQLVRLCTKLQFVEIDLDRQNQFSIRWFYFYCLTIVVQETMLAILKIHINS